MMCGNPTECLRLIENRASQNRSASTGSPDNGFFLSPLLKKINLRKNINAEISSLWQRHFSIGHKQFGQSITSSGMNFRNSCRVIQSIGILQSGRSCVSFFDGKVNFIKNLKSNWISVFEAVLQLNLSSLFHIMNA